MPALHIAASELEDNELAVTKNPDGSIMLFFYGKGTPHFFYLRKDTWAEIVSYADCTPEKSNAKV